MKYAMDTPTALVVLALGCGGQVGNASGTEGGITDSSSGDASNDGGDRSDGGGGDSPVMDSGSEDGNQPATRMPLNHRPAGSACPQQRAAVSAVQACSCTTPNGGSCSCGQCNRDSDCALGRNGRCGDYSPIPSSECSYDECFSDSDCDGGTPCQCRASSASANANICLTGSKCRVDSDCGPGGYCSPSRLMQWCGAMYYCHTPGDTCIDDSDCAANQEGCNFDTKSGHWACGGGCGPPPP
jgi:hypothetical protein